MKFAIAVLAVAALAVLAECKPSLAHLKEKLARRGNHAQRSEEPEWSAAWTELASLVGKCEIFDKVETLLEDVPEEENPINDFESILETACPIVLAVGEHLMGSDATKEAQASAIVEKAFPVMQCVNLEATKEVLILMMTFTEERIEDSLYLNESKPAFDACYKIFDDVESEESELVKDLNELDESILGEKERAVLAVLRRVLQYASKR